jgi:hypothetical protein
MIAQKIFGDGWMVHAYFVKLNGKMMKMYKITHSMNQ